MSSKFTVKKHTHLDQGIVYFEFSRFCVGTLKKGNNFAMVNFRVILSLAFVGVFGVDPFHSHQTHSKTFSHSVQPALS